MEEDFIKAIKEDNKIPIEIEEMVDDTLKNLKTRKKYTASRILSSIAASIILVFVSTVGYAFVTNQLPELLNFFRGNITEEKINEYGQFVNQTIKNEDAQITLTQVACDNNFLILCYDITTKDNLDTLWINNRDIEMDSISLYGSDGDIAFAKIDINKYKVYQTVPINYMTKKDVFDLKIDIDHIGGIAYENNEEVQYGYEFDKVNSVFELEVSRKKAVKDTKVIPIQQTLPIHFDNIFPNDYGVYIDQLLIAPFAVKLSMPTDIENDFRLRLLVYDENGNLLNDIKDSSNFRWATWAYDSGIYLSHIPEESNKLKAVLYYVETIEEERPEAYIAEYQKIEELPMSFKINDIGGKVIIDKVEETSDSVKVYYTKEGINFRDIAVKLKDKNGQMIKVKDDIYNYRMLRDDVDEIYSTEAYKNIKEELDYLYTTMAAKGMTEDEYTNMRIEKEKVYTKMLDELIYRDMTEAEIRFYYADRENKGYIEFEKADLDGAKITTYQQKVYQLHEFEIDIAIK